MIIQRRAFITGLFSSLAAPAIVRASSLMPVKALIIEPDIYFLRASIWAESNKFLKTVKWVKIDQVTGIHDAMLGVK